MTDADIVAAVDAYMADPSRSAFLFGEGYRIGLAEGIHAYEWASVTTTDKDATDHLKRTAVCNATLLARPEKV